MRHCQRKKRNVSDLTHFGGCVSGGDWDGSSGDPQCFILLSEGEIQAFQYSGIGLD